MLCADRERVFVPLRRIGRCRKPNAKCQGSDTVITDLAREGGSCVMTSQSHYEGAHESYCASSIRNLSEGTCFRFMASFVQYLTMIYFKIFT